MKSILRNILKNILGIFSRRVLSKHHAEVILVSGWTGTSIVREMIYHILKDKYNVRRNTKKIWWDLSVPLNILGYEDKKRNAIHWIFLIIRSFLSITFKPTYPHKVIIDLDTSRDETAAFWSKYVHADIVLLLKEKTNSKLLDIFLMRQGSEKTIFVYNPNYQQSFNTRIQRDFTYSSKKSDLIFQRNNKILKTQYKNNTLNIKIPEKLIFIWELIPPAISVCLLQRLDMQYISGRLPTFSIHSKELHSFLDNLKEFLHEKE